MSEAAKNLEDEGNFKILAKCSPGAVDLSKKNREQAAFADYAVRTPGRGQYGTEEWQVLPSLPAAWVEDSEKVSERRPLPLHCPPSGWKSKCRNT